VHRRIVMALIALTAAALLLSARAVSAQDDLELTSAPAGVPGVRKLEAPPDLRTLADEARVWSRLAAVFSGLALIGVLWVGWSQRALARNQVELAALIQQAGEMRE